MLFKPDKTNAGLINVEVTELLQTNEEKIITLSNIKEKHLDKYGLHINNIGTRMFAKSLLLGAQAICHANDFAICQAIFHAICHTKKLFTWFANEANDDKCHLLLSYPNDSAVIQIENSTKKCSKVKNYYEYILIINLNLMLM